MVLYDWWLGRANAVVELHRIRKSYKHLGLLHCPHLGRIIDVPPASCRVNYHSLGAITKPNSVELEFWSNKDSAWSVGARTKMIVRLA